MSRQRGPLQSLAPSGYTTSMKRTSRLRRRNHVRTNPDRLVLPRFRELFVETLEPRHMLAAVSVWWTASGDAAMATGQMDVAAASESVNPSPDTVARYASLVGLATDKADVAGESPQSQVLTLGANADQFLADQAESIVYWFSVTLSFGVRELASGKRACVNCKGSGLGVAVPVTVWGLSPGAKSEMGGRWGGIVPPILASGPGSALGLLPSRALSSVQVSEV